MLACQAVVVRGKISSMVCGNTFYHRTCQEKHLRAWGPRPCKAWCPACPAVPERYRIAAMACQTDFHYRPNQEKQLRALRGLHNLEKTEEFHHEVHQGHEEKLRLVDDLVLRSLFTGREMDLATGLYYYRARYYSAELGRFVSRDPISFAAGDANLYRYVGNDPTNFVDPSGLQYNTMPGPGGGYGISGGPSPGPFTDPGNLWKQLCKNGCSNCSKSDVENLVNTIQNTADTTWIFDLLPNGCERWIFAFENNLRGFKNPCVKERNVGWEPSNAIGGGHATYSFTLCDGTVIQVDHWIYYGGTRIKVIPPPPKPGGGGGGGSNCPNKCE